LFEGSVLGLEAELAVGARPFHSHLFQPVADSLQWAAPGRLSRLSAALHKAACSPDVPERATSATAAGPPRRAPEVGFWGASWWHQRFELVKDTAPRRTRRRYIAARVTLPLCR
jgi:hypothetical protein